MEKDFRRAVLFDKISPGSSLDDAWVARNKVEAMLTDSECRRHVVVAEVGGRCFVDVILGDPLPEDKAPPEYVDGVYVAVDRVIGFENMFKAESPKAIP